MSMPGDYRDPRLPENRTLGEAANRYVTFQIVAWAVGIVLFLLFFFTMFLPMWGAMPRWW